MYIQKSLEILSCGIYRYKYRGERLSNIANIIKFSVFFSLFLSPSFFLVSQTGKKCRKRFSDFRKWFKRLCWLTRRSWTKFHQESHSSPSFPSARSLCEEKGFLQLVKWKNSCIFSFSLSFSLLRSLRSFLSSHILTFNHTSSPPFWNSYNFFSGFFFLHFSPFLVFFSLKFDESHPVSTRTKGRRSYPVCANAQEI